MAMENINIPRCYKQETLTRLLNTPYIFQMQVNLDMVMLATEEWSMKMEMYTTVSFSESQ